MPIVYVSKALNMLLGLVALKIILGFDDFELTRVILVCVSIVGGLSFLELGLGDILVSTIKHTRSVSMNVWRYAKNIIIINATASLLAFVVFVYANKEVISDQTTLVVFIFASVLANLLRNVVFKLSYVSEKAKAYFLWELVLILFFLSLMGYSYSLGNQIFIVKLIYLYFILSGGLAFFFINLAVVVNRENDSTVDSFSGKKDIYLIFDNIITPVAIALLAIWVASFENTALVALFAVFIRFVNVISMFSMIYILKVWSLKYQSMRDWVFVKFTLKLFLFVIVSWVGVVLTLPIWRGFFLKGQRFDYYLVFFLLFLIFARVVPDFCSQFLKSVKKSNYAVYFNVFNFTLLCVGMMFVPHRYEVTALVVYSLFSMIAPICFVLHEKNNRI